MAMAMMTSINVKPRARAELFIFLSSSCFRSEGAGLEARRGPPIGAGRPLVERRSDPGHASELAVPFFTATDLKSRRQRSRQHRFRSSLAPDLLSPARSAAPAARRVSTRATRYLLTERLGPSFAHREGGAAQRRLQPRRDADDAEHHRHPARGRVAGPGFADLGELAELGPGRARRGDDAGARRGAQARPARRPHRDEPGARRGIQRRLDRLRRRQRQRRARHGRDDRPRPAGVPRRHARHDRPAARPCSPSTAAVSSRLRRR